MIVLRYATLLLIVSIAIVALVTPGIDPGLTTASKFATTKDDTQYG